MAAAPCSIKNHFAQLRDPRVCGRTRHLLVDIVVIAVCAVIAGANNWQQIATFGRARRDWFAQFLDLPNGIPAHDTFERVFEKISPIAFQRCFQKWLTALGKLLGADHIAIDGKTLRGSRDSSSELGPLHMVSAWATETNLILGQVGVADKSNEIPAIPQLLELLELKGAIVTMDAMGCQKNIAAKIVDGGGDYILTVKENQENLLHDIQQAFAAAGENDFKGVDYDVYETTETGHGRVEKRNYTIIRNPELSEGENWKGLKVIGMCYSERTVDGKTSEELRYFIGSMKGSAKMYGKTLRNHWRIENGLHWQLDVTFREDDSRIHKKRTAGKNFATIRRMALTLLKRAPGPGSVATKRYQATLDTDFLEKVLVAKKAA